MKAATWGRSGARRSTLLFRAFAFAVVCAGALSMLVPFFWMLVTSIKPPGEVFLYPPRWWPSEVRWANYGEALTVLPFGQWYLNTIFIMVVSTLGDLVTASLVGYAFARLRAPGRDFLFMLVISTMLLPHQVTMIPVFLIFRGMRAIDTFLPLWLRSWLGGGAFNIFLCRQFFLTLPLELDDAARIDGCGVVGIYWRIILPLSRPVLAAVTAFSAVAKWNEFLDPVVYLQSRAKYVVSIGLRLFQDYQATSYHWLMAAAVVTMLPCLLIFFIAQKSFVQGIATTGLKG
jgi:ABC-type glycerol-3-phosphate transport system permease component